MKYIELKVVVLLKNDISVKDCGYNVSKTLSSAMAKDDELLNYHNSNNFKLYSFDNLYPLANNGVYRKGSLYNFRLRSVNLPFIYKLKQLLFNHQTDVMKVIVVDEKTYFQKKINEIVTLTPILTTLPKEGESLDVNDLCNIQDDIIKNLVKKYNAHTNSNLSFDEAARIFTVATPSSKPISIRYKDISLIGVKYRFKIAPDTISQELAFLAEAVGLGEKNSSSGAGFCHAIYDKGGDLDD